MKEADDELEKLVESVSSKDEFRVKYEQYKQKYSMFIFNETDLSDLSPYFAIENNLTANYVNENAQVMIGSKLITNKTLNTYAEKFNTSTISTYAEEDLPLNNALGTQVKEKLGYILV